MKTVLASALLLATSGGFSAWSTPGIASLELRNDVVIQSSPSPDMGGYSPTKQVKKKKKKKKKVAPLSTRDSDGDFLTDRDEIRKFHTNPHSKDTSRNGILDGDEDSDHDGVPNEDEDDGNSLAKKRVGNLDPDKDGLCTEDEDEWGMNSKKADSDRDGVLDGNEDSDENGIANEDEDDFFDSRSTTEDRDDDSAPRPIPRPSVPQLNFDPNGNVTSVGKDRFAIPQRLGANWHLGEAVWTANCVGCHEAKLGRQFTAYQDRITKSPMFIFLEEGDLANLTAYLNRYRTDF